MSKKDVYSRLNKASSGRCVNVPISLSTLALLLDGNCPDKEEVIQFYERYLKDFPTGLDPSDD